MNQLEQFIAQTKAEVIGLAVYDLQTRQEILVNADEFFHPASTIKVAVMMEVFRQVEAGTLSLDERIPLINSFTSIADGSTFQVAEKDDSETSLYPRLGQRETIRELVRLMIVRSGNLATNILLEKVSAKRVNAFLQELDIHGITVKRGVEDNVAFRLGMNNSATARGLTQMMRAIAEGRVISRAVCDEMIHILLGQEFNESIPALLPASVKVAHKTGWTGPFFHDTGIVLPPNRQPYVITIMTRGFPEENGEEAHACMAEISKMVYAQIS